MKTVAVYKEDIWYGNHPYYILDEQTGYFILEGNPEFKYAEADVFSSQDFMVIQLDKEDVSSVLI